MEVTIPPLPKANRPRFTEDDSEEEELMQVDETGGLLGGEDSGEKAEEKGGLGEAAEAPTSHQHQSSGDGGDRDREENDEADRKPSRSLSLSPSMLAATPLEDVVDDEKAATTTLIGPPDLGLDDYASSDDESKKAAL